MAFWFGISHDRQYWLRRQPVGPVGIDWTNPLTRNLVAFWLARPGGVYNLVTRQRAVESGTVDYVLGRPGHLAQLTALTNSLSDSSARDVVSGKLSVWASFVPNDTARGDLVTRWSNGATAGDQFNLLTGVTSAKARFYISSGSATANSGDSTTTLSAGSLYHIGGANDGTNCRIYVDGNEENSGANGAVTMTAAPTISYRLGNTTTFNDGDLNGWIEGAAVWDGYFGSELFREMYVNPYQFLRPLARRRIVIAPSAAGPIAGAADLIFGAGSSTLKGTGALAGSAALLFGAGSSTLTATGTLAGSAAQLFGAGSSTLTGAGALAGSAAQLFGAGASTLAGSGALAGTAAEVFGAGSSTLRGAGALSGAAAVTFTPTGTLTLPSGSIAGTAAMLFGSGSSTLVGAGALAGSAPLIFGAGSSTLYGIRQASGTAALLFGLTGTLEQPGAILGTAGMTFGAGASLLTGTGSLSGSGAMLFGGAGVCLPLGIVTASAGTFRVEPRAKFVVQRGAPPTLH